MTYILIPAELVIQLHDAALNPGELPGMARDKSLDSALSRVENRVAYDMIGDAFDLAAAYAVAVAQGHCFNDGNKRTAFDSMNFCLELHGIVLDWATEDTGDTIIRAAQGLIDAEDLATWLRARAT